MASLFPGHCVKKLGIVLKLLFIFKNIQMESIHSDYAHAKITRQDVKSSETTIDFSPPGRKNTASKGHFESIENSNTIRMWFSDASSHEHSEHKKTTVEFGQFQ